MTADGIYPPWAIIHSMAKSWSDKLSTGIPKVETIDRPFAGFPAGATMLVSSPREVQELVAGLQKGQCLTIPDVRAALAKQHGADFTCPLTTSIFLRIVSEAAWDAHLAGEPIDRITPFWRAIAPNDKIAKKLRCGIDFIENARRSEGIGR